MLKHSKSDKHELSDLTGKLIKTIEKTIIPAGLDENDENILKNAYKIITGDKKEFILLCEEGKTSSHYTANLLNPEEFQALCDEYNEDLLLEEEDLDDEEDPFDTFVEDGYIEEDDELEDE